MGVIFISHSSRNSEKAVEVRDWLRNEGYAEAFLDLDPEHGLAPGQKWQEELKKAGENCSAILILVSPDWCASEWCQTEFLVASQLGKKIFPVMIEPTSFDVIRVELKAHFQIADISTPEIMADGYERLRFGLKRAGLHPKDFSWPPEDAPDRLAYRGLKTMEEADAAVFFGRDAEITKGLDALRQMRDGYKERILAIMARSGAGKSSFLRAGLLSRLDRDSENFLVLPAMRPGRDALNGETGLLHCLGLASLDTGDEGISNHLGAMQAEVTDRLRRHAEAGGLEHNLKPPSLILPLDQAEELFSADNDTATEALALLRRCLAIKPDLIIILTVRDDSIAALDYFDRDPPVPVKEFRLPALSVSAFKEVIEGPGTLSIPPIKFEPALTTRLVDDLDEADALPLLAFTLERLVIGYGDDNLLKLHEYTDGLGGISGAINAAVQAAYDDALRDPALPEDRTRLDTLARSAFIPWLVQLDEADASPKRRITKLSDIPADARPLIAHLTEHRLLTTSEQDGARMIEVSHESVLRHWRGLAAWIGEERTELHRLQEVKRAADLWQTDTRGGERTNDMLVHRGERLLLAEELLLRPDLARDLEGRASLYLNTCRQDEEKMVKQEQRRKRTLRLGMTGLILLMIVTSIVTASVTAVSYFQIKDVQNFVNEQAIVSKASLQVTAGEAGRERETMRSELIAIREEAASSRRQSDLAQRVERAVLNNRIREYRGSALQIAHDHILGTPLNSATALVVTSVLSEAEEDGGNFLSDDEALLLRTVRADWFGLVDATQTGFETMRNESDDQSIRALGAAGLAMLYYRQASVLNFAWNEGCREVVENIAVAEDMRLQAPTLFLWKADCLRKHGDTLKAYYAFNAALTRLEAGAATGREPPQEQMRLAYHGTGMTLVALAARDEVPSDRVGEDSLETSLRLFENAADIRRQRGATPVGIAYTLENIGFIYIQLQDWDSALRHTAMIDHILPLAWNLTNRHIAATEKANALVTKEDADPADVAKYREIAEEAALVLSLMQYSQFDEPELKRLLPKKYEAVINRLIAPSLGRESLVIDSD